VQTEDALEPRSLDQACTLARCEFRIDEYELWAERLRHQAADEAIRH
jgi:hypothetical protein